MYRLAMLAAYLSIKQVLLQLEHIDRCGVRPNQSAFVLGEHIQLYLKQLVGVKIHPHLVDSIGMQLLLQLVLPHQSQLRLVIGLLSVKLSYLEKYRGV